MVSLTGWEPTNEKSIDELIRQSDNAPELIDIEIIVDGDNVVQAIVDDDESLLETAIDDDLTNSAIHVAGHLPVITA